eukprot:5774334-Amphidinium_carterae.1
MTQEIKSIEDRGRQAADELVMAFQRRSGSRSANQKSADQREIDKLRHENDLLVSQRDAAHAQLQRPAQFCAQVRNQAMEHQNRMVAEAKALRQHTANERRELLSSCQRKAEETASMLRSQLDAEKANVEQTVRRTLSSEREKLLRETAKQQDVLTGQARAELDRAQQEIERLHAQAESAERDRDASMNQLAAEKIRSTQMSNHCAQLVYEKSELTAQFVDLTRHAAVLGARQDIHWSNREPEDFKEYVEEVVNSNNSGIHLTPPFANQTRSPPALDRPIEEADVAPQTPDRRPQHSSLSPQFGLMRVRGSASNGKGAGSSPDRVMDVAHPLSGGNVPDPLMGGTGYQIRSGGRGGDGGGGDDDDDNDPNNNGNGGNRGNQPLGAWDEENDPWNGEGFTRWE